LSDFFFVCLVVRLVVWLVYNKIKSSIHLNISK